MTELVPKKKKNKLQITAWVLLAVSGAITIWYICRLWGNNYRPLGEGLNVAETGEVGDFVGGFVGTIINAAAFLFLYLTLKDQRKATFHQQESFAKERFENRFFELLKLHRDNVTEMEYIDPYDGQKNYSGRRVFKYVNDQIDSCIKEITPIFDDHTIDEIYKDEALEKLNAILLYRPKIDITQWALCNVAYSIVFFGIAGFDFETLSRHLQTSYKENFFLKVLNYINLKTTTKSDFRKNWDLIKNEDWKIVINAVEAIGLSKDYEVRDSEKGTYMESVKILLSKKYFKYYGGHQFKLGHYFRHLFQTVKYVDGNKDMGYVEKYEYIKILRAQLSNYEQVVLFFNSLSFMGGSWELNQYANPNVNKHLITKYNIIKNLPELFLFRSVFVNCYYPNVSYEFAEISPERATLIVKYN